jgi:hypothetical protein
MLEKPLRFKDGYEYGKHKKISIFLFVLVLVISALLFTRYIRVFDLHSDTGCETIGCIYNFEIRISIANNTPTGNSLHDLIYQLMHRWVDVKIGKGYLGNGIFSYGKDGMYCGEIISYYIGYIYNREFSLTGRYTARRFYLSLLDTCGNISPPYFYWGSR